MKAEFQSVLSMIPTDKFHSAVITGYSFDFCFFERILLGQLHRAGVTNCLVLIDQSMLEDSLGRLSGAARTKSRGYSLVGIPSQGAFHPKLLLLIGESNGLLFVGSGNPTASGFGGNLELWGAISISGPDDSKINLIRHAWSFVSANRQFIGGRSAVRIDWIEKHAPWLSIVTTTTDRRSVELEHGCRCYFLATSGESILRQVKEAIGSKIVTKIEVFAPFFDESLSAVKNLAEVFNCDAVDIFIQPETAKFSSDALEGLPFKPNVYDVNEALGVDDPTSYLHAKAIRLVTKDRDFLLLGSANVSVAALGDMKFRGTNDEACLLMERDGGDFFADLGLRAGDLVPVQEFAQIQKTDDKTNATTRSIHLRGIDTNEGLFECIAVMLDGQKVPGSAELRLFNGLGIAIAQLPIDCQAFTQGKPASVKVNITNERPLYGQIFERGNPISNAQIVHEVSDIFRADPNPANRKLEAALSQLEFGQSDIFDVLRTIDLNVILDDPQEAVEPIEKCSVGNSEVVGSESVHIGQKLDYEAFLNDKAANSSVRDSLFRKTLPIERVYEVLSKLVNRTTRTEEDVQLEEEESDSYTESFDRPVPQVNTLEFREESSSQIRNLRKRIIRFLRDYESKLDSLLAGSEPISTADLTRFCVVSHMVIGLSGITVKEKGQADTKPIPLLDIFLSPFGSSCMTGFMFNCVGRFLRLALFGFARGETELEAERLRGLKETAMFHVLFILGLTPEDKCEMDQWNSERWILWRWGILQNSLFVFGQMKPDRAKLVAEFEKRRGIYPGIVRTDELVARVTRMYQGCIDQATAAESKLPSVGSRSYFQKYGFVVIKKVEPWGTLGESKVKFSGPGFPLDEDQFDFIAGSAFIWPRAKIRVFL